MHIDSKTSHILIIKHSALGDMVLATSAIKAIRSAFPESHISLLTASPYQHMMAPCPWIDSIMVDSRPKWWQWNALKALKQQLRAHRYNWVFDLQTSSRSTYYFSLLPTPKPNVSGLAQGASHRHDTEERKQLHTLDRQRQQLDIAGVPSLGQPDISWMVSDTNIVQHVTKPFVLMVPGGSAHRPEKRYPVEHYVALCQHYSQHGVQPVLIGTQAEADVLDAITSACEDCVSLCGKTGFGDIAELGRHAYAAIGNDTGPMHIIAATGCVSIVLFSDASNPDLCAPRGDHVIIHQRKSLSSLLPDDVVSMLDAHLQSHGA